MLSSSTPSKSKINLDFFNQAAAELSSVEKKSSTKEQSFLFLLADILGKNETELKADIIAHGNSFYFTFKLYLQELRNKLHQDDAGVKIKLQYHFAGLKGNYNVFLSDEFSNALNDELHYGVLDHSARVAARFTGVEKILSTQKLPNTSKNIAILLRIQTAQTTLHETIHELMQDDCTLEEANKYADALKDVITNLTSLLKLNRRDFSTQQQRQLEEYIKAQKRLRNHIISVSQTKQNKTLDFLSLASERSFERFLRSKCRSVFGKAYDVNNKRTNELARALLLKMGYGSEFIDNWMTLMVEENQDMGVLHSPETMLKTLDDFISTLNSKEDLLSQKDFQDFLNDMLQARSEILNEMTTYCTVGSSHEGEYGLTNPYLYGEENLLNEINNFLDEIKKIDYELKAYNQTPPAMLGLSQQHLIHELYEKRDILQKKLAQKQREYQKFASTDHLQQMRKLAHEREQLSDHLQSHFSKANPVKREPEVKLDFFDRLQRKGIKGHRPDDVDRADFHHRRLNPVIDEAKTTKKKPNFIELGMSYISKCTDALFGRDAIQPGEFGVFASSWERNAAYKYRKTFLGKLLDMQAIFFSPATLPSLRYLINENETQRLQSKSITSSTSITTSTSLSPQSQSTLSYVELMKPANLSIAESAISQMRSSSFKLLGSPLNIEVEANKVEIVLVNLALYKSINEYLGVVQDLGQQFNELGDGWHPSRAYLREIISRAMCSIVELHFCKNKNLLPITIQQFNTAKFWLEQCSDINPKHVNRMITLLNNKINHAKDNGCDLDNYKLNEDKSLKINTLTHGQKEQRALQRFEDVFKHHVIKHTHHALGVSAGGLTESSLLCKTANGLFDAASSYVPGMGLASAFVNRMEQDQVQAGADNIGMSIVNPGEWDNFIDKTFAPVLREIFTQHICEVEDPASFAEYLAKNLMAAMKKSTFLNAFKACENESQKIRVLLVSIFNENERLGILGWGKDTYKGVDGDSKSYSSILSKAAIVYQGTKHHGNLSIAATETFEKERWVEDRKDKKKPTDNKYKGLLFNERVTQKISEKDIEMFADAVHRVKLVKPKAS